MLLYRISSAENYQHVIRKKRQHLLHDIFIIAASAMCLRQKQKHNIVGGLRRFLIQGNSMAVSFSDGTQIVSQQLSHIF